MPDEGNPLEAFADRVADPTPAPGGGAVAAVTGAFAAALVEMVAGLALHRSASAENSSLTALLDAANRLRRRLLVLAAQDERAFASVTAARRTGGGPAALSAAWEAACRVPAEVVRLEREVALLARQAAQEGPPAALGDAVMAALLAAAAATGSQVNLRLNLEAAGRPNALRLLEEGTEIELREAQHAAAETRRLVEERLKRGGEAARGPG
jgi:formiminotetrahydrofolate cyclodeaminase